MLLTYDVLAAGMTFEPVDFAVTPALVAAYEAATGTPWTPPGLAGVWARLGYQHGHELPAGGVLAGMTVENVRAYDVGTTLTLRSAVVETGPRRRVVLVTEASDGEGVVGRVTIDARWGA